MANLFNRVSPKVLINSKWTKIDYANKEKHFIVIEVKFDDDRQVTDCTIEAVMTKNTYPINWRELKLKNKWAMGWQ